jgi:hypothetical protein
VSEQEQVRRVKEFHKASILARPNVLGVGTGYKVSKGAKTDQLCVVALVRQKVPKEGLATEALLPESVDGVSIDVIEVGDLRALQARTDRWRPVPGGVSLGHYKITAGTFGAVVRDRATGDRLILSNNHVLANSNDASPGDPIIQPGAADGGQVSTDTIAHLERFVPLDFGTQPPVCNIATTVVVLANLLARLMTSKHRLQALQADPAATNLVDAAVARPVNDVEILDEILEIGVVQGTTPAVLGMPVRKSGRTTAFTTGEILVLDATVSVSYGAGRTASFENQIVTTPMSQGGDSGSLLVDGNSQQAVGLLFAGSEQSTIHSPIQAVLDSLEIDI